MAEKQVKNEENRDKIESLISEFEKRKIPYIVVYNKSDIISHSGITVSALTGDGVNELKEKIGHLINDNKKEKFIIKDRLQAGDIVIMVIPIDESAPKGRIILPQQNTLREILDAHATAICCGVNELDDILKKVTPKYVITDSQAFNEVKKIVPENITETERTNKEDYITIMNANIELLKEELYN